MGVKLHKNEPVDAINAGDLSDGKIAVILEWNGSLSERGFIVQRYGEALVRVGSRSGQSWPTFFANRTKDIAASFYRVRILRPGELIEIT